MPFSPNEKKTFIECIMRKKTFSFFAASIRSTYSIDFLSLFSELFLSFISAYYSNNNRKIKNVDTTGCYKLI